MYVCIYLFSYGSMLLFTKNLGTKKLFFFGELHHLFMIYQGDSEVQTQTNIHNKIKSLLYAQKKAQIRSSCKGTMTSILEMNDETDQ